MDNEAGKGNGCKGIEVYRQKEGIGRFIDRIDCSFAVVKLDKEIMPSVGKDGAYVMIDAGGMAAIDMERFVTSPLEQKLEGVEGVEEIRSTNGGSA